MTQPNGDSWSLDWDAVVEMDEAVESVRTFEERLGVRSVRIAPMQPPPDLADQVSAYRRMFIEDESSAFRQRFVTGDLTPPRPPIRRPAVRSDVLFVPNERIGRHIATGPRYNHLWRRPRLVYSSNLSSITGLMVRKVWVFPGTAVLPGYDGILQSLRNARVRGSLEGETPERRRKLYFWLGEGDHRRDHPEGIRVRDSDLWYEA